MWREHPEKVSKAAAKCIDALEELLDARENFADSARANLEEINERLQNLSLPPYAKNTSPEKRESTPAWAEYRKNQLRILKEVDVDSLPTGFKNDFIEALAELKSEARENLRIPSERRSSKAHLQPAGR